MTLRVAVQMDPLEHINISGDSTFAIMLGAQARGYKLYHYLADALTWQNGRLYAGAHEVSVQPVAGDHFKLGEFTICWSCASETLSSAACCLSCAI